MKEKHTKKQKISVLLLIIINIAVLAAVMLLSVAYGYTVSKNAEKAILGTYSTTVSTMENTAHEYLRNQQLVCNDWAKYINKHHPSVESAMKYLSDANSNPNVMVHLISADTYCGFSTIPNDDGNTAVSYEYLKHIGISDATEESSKETPICISCKYANPINGLPSVSFFQTVYLQQGDGASLSRYFLLRVIPISVVHESWKFPSEFKDAELSLTKSNGDYIIRSASLKQSNFWEHIRIYNDLGYKETDALSEKMISSGDVYVGKNSAKEGAYYIFRANQQNEDFCYVAYLPGNAVSVNGVDLTITIIVSVGFLILIVLNGSFILFINRRLKISMEHAKEADSAKTRFLSSMSHDIRTPMNAIIGMTTIASKHADDPVHVSECLKKITLASNHLLTLINDVLDISKVESGKMTLTPVAFSLSDLVNGVIDIIRSEIKSKGLEFEIHTWNIVHENLFADELRLNQIFINLLSNAVKYTPSGGKVTMSVKETLLPDDPHSIGLTFIVQDTGVGMSEEFQKNMYSAFVRAVDTRIDKVQGSGLGLAIVKQMVDLMGGSIVCDSAPGVGTKFTVSLKLAIADKVADDFVLPPMELLIVDDDEVFLETASETLESMNLKVDTVNNGADAVEMIAKRHESGKNYPAVIIDLKMPGMDGFETTRKIRERVGDEVPIILISSYGVTDVENEAMEAGANAFINKPLFKSDVYYKMNEIFRLNGENEKDAEPMFSEFEDLHLLVAEDNDMNWEIISELLGYYKIKTSRAENGQICIKMLEESAAGEYDAILMDVQMPVMNGKDASIAIRKMENPEKSGIPIIAMTADAFAEDIKACLDAGMNGHIAKPLDMNKLFAELSKAVKMKRGKNPGKQKQA